MAGLSHLNSFYIAGGVVVAFVAVVMSINTHRWIDRSERDIEVERRLTVLECRAGIRQCDPDDKLKPEIGGSR